METILYITFQYIKPADGVSKKVFSQIKSFVKCGLKTDLIYPIREENKICYYLNNELFFEVSLLSNYRRLNRLFFNKLQDLCIERKYDYAYIRYNCNSNNKFISLLNTLKINGTRVLLEIPTYPYDKELKRNTDGSIVKRLFKYLLFIREMINRTQLIKYVHRIITTSDYDIIFGIKTIRISNGVDPDGLTLVKDNLGVGKCINLITVANIAYWHGLDRLIEGLHLYYSKEYEKEVIINIVGDGDINVIESLKDLVQHYDLKKYVIFHGAMDGSFLEELFHEMDFAIGCLGCHRKKVTNVRSLKNVEYAMRGIPFMYSEDNTDFDDKPYILKASPDDSPISIVSMLNFIDSCNISISKYDIRNSVNHLTWDNQINTILKSVKDTGKYDN